MIDRWSMRTAVLFSSPLLMTISGLIHPHPPFSQPGMLDFLRPFLAANVLLHRDGLLPGRERSGTR